MGRLPLPHDRGLHLHLFLSKLSPSAREIEDETRRCETELGDVGRCERFVFIVCVTVWIALTVLYAKDGPMEEIFCPRDSVFLSTKCALVRIVRTTMQLRIALKIAHRT